MNFSGRGQTSERARGCNRGAESTTKTFGQKEFRAEFAQQLQTGTRSGGRRAFGHSVSQTQGRGKVPTFGCYVEASRKN